jgi:A/G-specific adenine glycosylase
MSDEQPRLQASCRAWVRRRLLAWFARHARDLPWRATRDPYAIWVSEVMLQQTQVATVISFYKRFLQKFPSLAALARADLQEVLRSWEGLGYYRRARDLHEAARVLHGREADTIPDDPELLGSLPGLGRYTVGAVLSQAFDRRLPILEANSVRVLCRFLGVSADPRKGSVRRGLWEAAAALLPTKSVGQFNQALMELGALVCTPSSPRCGDCPLARRCRARLNGVQAQIPLSARAPATTHVTEVAVVVQRQREVLLVQRPATGRWGGLWEFPHTVQAPGESSMTTGRRLLADLQIQAELGEEILTIRHSVTRFRITLVCLAARYRRGRLRRSGYAEARWVGRDQLHDFPVSSPQRRLARLIE